MTGALHAGGSVSESLQLVAVGVDSPRCSIGQHSASCSMIGGTTRTARVLRTSP